MTLTVAIPTYNRNRQLGATLEHLLPQLTPECQLLIIDNASDIPVADTLRATLARFPAVAPRLVRNRVNIGGNANILRCFELCDTDWLWVLGDDDEVLPGAVTTILAHLDAYPESLFFNFAYDPWRKHSVLASGIKELVKSLDASANLPFMSSEIYKAPAVLPYLKFGYQYAYSMLPHLAILFMAIGETGICCLSRERIIDTIREPVSADQQWSQINFSLGFPTLLDLPLRPDVREGLAKKLLVTNFFHGPNLRVLAYQLLLTAVKDQDHRNALYYHDQIYSRGYYFDAGIRSKAALWGIRFLLRFRKVAAASYRFWKGRALGEQNFQDRYERM